MRMPEPAREPGQKGPCPVCGDAGGHFGTEGADGSLTAVLPQFGGTAVLQLPVSTKELMEADPAEAGARLITRLRAAFECSRKQMVRAREAKLRESTPAPSSN